jgi:ATP-dependent protease ClpP protease subunit
MKLMMGLLILLACQQSFAFTEGYTVNTKVIGRAGKDSLTIVIIDGALNKGVASDTIAAIKNAPSKDIYLELNSPGGFFQEAQDIYDYIKAEKNNGLNVATYVPSGSACGSACTIIFMAGEERIAGEAAAFMVHGAQRESMPGFLNPLITNHIQQLYRDNGVSNDWIVELRKKLVFSGINDFWFSGRDAASKEVGFATIMHSGLIEYDPPKIDPQIHAR